MNASWEAPWSSTVLVFGFDVAIKATAILMIVLVIGPDGKIVAKNLWRENISKAVGEALGQAHK